MKTTTLKRTREGQQQRELDKNHNSYKMNKGGLTIKVTMQMQMRYKYKKRECEERT